MTKDNERIWTRKEITKNDLKDWKIWIKEEGKKYDKKEAEKYS